LHQQLPADAAMVFQWDFTGKVPKAVLMAMDFSFIKKYLYSKT